MGEDREIGASVLAGARARGPSPIARGVRSGGSAPAAGISRGGDRHGPTGMAGARGASLPWRGERSLGCPRSAARAGYLAGGPAAGACARWVACVRVPLRLVVIALKYPIVAKYVVADM